MIAPVDLPYFAAYLPCPVRFPPRTLLAVVLAWACAAPALAAPPDPPGSFRVLCWHDVRDHVALGGDDEPDPEAVETAELERQFAWLKANSYAPVTLSRIVAARAGGPPLPAHAVLLTFDDGFKSVFTKVFPLLRKYRYPAVVGLVTGWMDTAPGARTDYGDAGLPRAAFVSWPEVRVMAASGLVEVASHTHHLHRGIDANPQGNLVPAAVTRRWGGPGRGYETEGAYLARVDGDLRESVRRIVRGAGVRPRALIWPYGDYNRAGLALARKLGLTVTLNMEAGPNTPAIPLAEMRRTRIPHRAKASDLAAILREPDGRAQESGESQRVVHVDLDYVYDTDPAQQESNLGRLVDRIAALAPSTVYLQAFADPDGDGVADAVYFPNRRMPMRSDLFSRAAWQLKTRTSVRVYAWMPVLGFRLPDGDTAAGKVVRRDPEVPEDDGSRYRRLSPFDPEARAAIRQIYADLGRSSRIDGVLFHDDAVMFEDEDASPAARAWYRSAWKLPGSVAAIRANPRTTHRFARLKTDFVDNFTLELADLLRAEHPGLLTARNIYADAVFDPEAGERLGQSYERAVRIYDHASVMAMPYLEGASDAREWLARLVARVKATPGALARTVFELQSLDWNTGRPVPARLLAEQMKALVQAGARGYGYYPDDFVRDSPAAAIVKRALSLRK